MYVYSMSFFSIGLIFLQPATWVSVSNVLLLECLSTQGHVFCFLFCNIGSKKMTRVLFMLTSLDLHNSKFSITFSLNSFITALIESFLFVKDYAIKNHQCCSFQRKSDFPKFAIITETD